MSEENKTETKNEVAVVETNAVTRKPPKATTVAEMMTHPSMQTNLEKVLPNGIDVARFLAVANTQIRKNPSIGKCSPASVFNCMMQSARLGVMPDGRNAYLIPYGTECTLQFDYKGWVDLLLRNGVVRKVYADVICVNDNYSYNMGVLEYHKVKLGNRGEVIAAYATAYLPNGEVQTEVIEVEEIEKIRSKSMNKNRGPWVEFYKEMCKKVAFKRLTKWLKVTPDIVEALDADNEEFRNGNAQPSATPAPVVPRQTTVSNVIPALANNGQEEEQEQQAPFSM